MLNNSKAKAEVQQMKQLFSNIMSGSQLDLIMHGDEDPLTPSQTKVQCFENKFAPDEVDCELEMVEIQPNSNLYSRSYNNRSDI